MFTLTLKAPGIELVSTFNNPKEFGEEASGPGQGEKAPGELTPEAIERVRQDVLGV